MTLLANERLLVTNRSELVEDTVEVVHEALIRNWGRLRGWMDDNREGIKQKLKIEFAAKEWVENKNFKHYLLQGKRLKEVVRWKKENIIFLPLSLIAIDFIRASIKQNRRNIVHRYIFILIFVCSLSISVFTIYIYFMFLFGIDSVIKSDEYQSSMNMGVTKIKLGTRDEIEIHIKKGKSLENFDLIGKNLNGINFSGVNLKYANLSNTNLTGANLASANLKFANLSNTNLAGANLARANLSGVNLTNANLTSTNLIGANLTNASLDNTNLTKSNLNGADLKESSLKNVKLNFATINNANLSSTFVEGANLHKTSLIGTNFSNAFILRANFYSAKLKNININNAYLIDVKYLNLGQIKSSQNWKKAKYDKDIRIQLGLP